LLASLESEMVSFERCINMTKVIQEAPQRIDTESDKPWITQGHIEFSRLSLRYRLDTPLVLHNVSLKINAGDKIGVVGRTGAGKSTL
jgi:ABC-type multidrug transport system fused ATPase/permease subunit